MRKFHWVAGAAVLVIAACEKIESKAVRSESPTTTRGVAVVGSPARDMPVVPSGSTQNLTAASAFRLAFEGETRVSVRRRGYNISEVFRFAPAGLVRVRDDTIALISSGTNARTCHGCQGTLGIHYFRRQGSNWTLVGAWPALMGGNRYGKPPKWRQRSDLDSAVWIQSGYELRTPAANCAYADLVELTPWGPEFRGKEILLHYDNGAAAAAGSINIDGQLGKGPDRKLRVTFGGTRSGFTDYEIDGPNLAPLPGDTIDAC